MRVTPPEALAERSRSGAATPEAAKAVSWSTLARQGHFRRAYETAAASGFEAECERCAADELLLLGDTARLSGHADHARHAYLTLRRRFAGSTAAAQAAFHLGRLAGGGDRWFETYLAEQPGGPLAEAALGRLLEAAVQRGDVARARVLAKTYLERHPAGAHADQAREILGASRAGLARGRDEARARGAAFERCSGWFWPALLTTFSVALAAGKARVVLMSEGEPALGRKVRAEATAAGLVIVEASRDGTGASDAELLERHDASALIQLISADRARVYVGRQEDGPSSRTLIRRAGRRRIICRARRRRGVRAPGRAQARGSGRSDGAGAPGFERTGDRAPVPERETPAETELKASPADARPGGNPPPAELDRKPGRRGGEPAPRLWLTGGLAATQAEGGMGATGHAALGLRLEPARRFSLAAHALLPVTENSLSGPEGTADVNVNLFLAELGYTLFEPADSWSVQAGAGAGVAVLAMQGEAALPLSGQSDRLTAGIYFAQGGVAWSVASWLRVTGMVLGGVSAPRPVARFSEREVATWGRAFAGAMLSSEFGLALTQSGKP